MLAPGKRTRDPSVLLFCENSLYGGKNINTTFNMNVGDVVKSRDKVYITTAAGEFDAETDAQFRGDH